ncbi:protein trichome birefringence-like 33 [Salvia miltiorrhiza]|uniref:protein trichome birefringence-like 33 n=1 Tax=Salvia miltiorrhiza TaxID=226208 RepID=UPI0025AC6554|nr:protein trichome birefringence-like 33 [Salvia miltiorrhiza]
MENRGGVQISPPIVEEVGARRRNTSGREREQSCGDRWLCMRRRSSQRPPRTIEKRRSRVSAKRGQWRRVGGCGGAAPSPWRRRGDKGVAVRSMLIPLSTKEEEEEMKKTIVGNIVMKPSPSPSSSSILSPSLLLALILSAVVIYSSGFCYISRLYDHHPPIPLAVHFKMKTRERLPFAIGEGDGNCDMFGGRWVRDYDQPPYEESDCPYIGGQLTCLGHGRPDKDYRYWRWQPNACSLPSFNATLMLEELRGKRMIFVGDSLFRGQFTSLVCLLHRVIPPHAQSMETIHSLTIFTAKDYNATIEFYWMPFLVESNADDPKMHKVDHRIIRNAPIGRHGQYWKGADIILFNTYIWRGSLEDEAKETVKVSMEDGYRVALKMLIRWINENIDPNKTRLFFVGLSATHQRSSKWGGAPKGNCYNETAMIEDGRYMGVERSLFPIIEEELSKSAVPITFLNISEVTSRRKDAHTSIYKAYRRPLTPTQRANPIPYADCIHWCLPGVQDVWNHLFFAKLFFP